jgi:hypothetical protein
MYLFDILYQYSGCRTSHAIQAYLDVKRENMTNRIVYLPLERYEERYSLQLAEWNEARFKARGVPYLIVDGRTLNDDKEIKTGQVLDAHGRCYWSMTQMAELVRLMESGEVGGNDVIFSEDLFQPGYEALPYIMEQLPVDKKPKVFTRNLAQSIDPDDFVFPWRNWMRDFEQLVSKTCDGILMANTEMGPHMRIALLEAPLYVTGLPFDREEVRGRIGGKEALKPLSERKKRIVYSSRFDKEKQPWFFMDLIEQSDFVERGYEFAILTGGKGLRSTNPEYVERALALEAAGKLKIYAGLKKNEYYSFLADSQLQFNCGRQDWQSNTLNEASALGTLSLCPAFRSFPEALNNNEKHLFVPWSLNDAIKKMDYLLTSLDDSDVNYAADDQHLTIDRTIDILLGQGEQYRYNG